MALMAPAGSELFRRREKPFGDNDALKELTYNFGKITHSLHVYKLFTKYSICSLICIEIANPSNSL